MATQVSHSGVGERIAKVSALSGVLAIAVLGSMVLADPQGEQVIRGDVNFTRDGALTTIRASDNSIINYQKFDIGRQETVRFIQPDATSRVLNRVTGPDPSRFEGTLLANGRVYFVNPAGVFFANGVLVNAAGLYAAAGHMSDQDFLRGMNRFTNVTGQVMNYGTINASEFVHLVGARVGNLGSIVVPGGVVTMTAGREVYLSELNGHILVKVEGADATAAASPAPGVENAGTISAPGGQVQLGAGDMYSLAIRNTGAIKARDIALEGGTGGVVKVAGVLDASDRSPGAKGGTVKVLGEKIAVGGARVDASGDAGGGTVLIGGGYQGKAADIRNALRTNVGEGTVIAADARSEEHTSELQSLS
jgi:filamentous hemagglutinin family protein